jgi:hypothetical protein
MMRTLPFTALLLLILATVVVAPGAGAATTAPTDFLSWALERSGEYDVRWNRIANVRVGADAPSLSDSFETISQSLSSSEKIVLGSKLSHSIISTRSFIHPVEAPLEFLPASTRERGDAARGAQSLKNPAHTHLSVPYDVKRPLNSSVQQKKFIAEFGDISRPRLGSFGHISKSPRLNNGGVSRPAWGGDRPRKL